MKRISRRIGKIFLGALGALCILWVAAGFWIRTSGPSWLIKELKHRYQFDVSIENASTDYFNSVSLHGIEIRSPIQARIELATLSFHPRTLLPSRKIAPSLLLLELHHPRIDLPASTFSSPSKKGDFSISLLTLPLRIVFDEAQVNIQTDDSHYSLSSVNGQVAMNPFRLKFSIEGNGGAWGHFETDGTVKLQKRLPWKATIKTVGLDAHAILSQFPSKANDIGDLNGLIDLSADAQGNARGPKLFSQWDVTARTKHLEWIDPKTDTVVPISATVKMLPSGIIIESADVNQGIKMTGKISPPWSHPRLDLIAKAENYPVHSLMERIAPKTLLDNVAGKTSFVFKIQGDSQAPSVEGTFSIEPSYGRVLFPVSKGQLSFRDSALKVDADFADGRIVLDKSRLALNGISFQSIAEKNGWENVHGTLTTNLTWESHKQNSSFNGQYALHDLRWGRYRAKQTILGQLNLTQGSINITSEDQSLLLQASRKNSFIQVEQLHLGFGEDSSFGARGSGTFPDGNLSFQIQGKNIPPDLWPPLVKRYPTIQGSLDMEGTVNGSAREPHLELTTLFHNLQFEKEGNQWNGTAKLTADREKLALRNIQVDGGYSGEVVWELGENQGKLTARANLIDATPSLFRDVFKLETELSGRLTGEAQIEYDGQWVTGASSLTWTAGQIGEVTFDQFLGHGEMKPGKIIVSEARIVDKNKVLRGQGEVTYAEKAWNYEATLQLQRWGGSSLFLDGEVQSTGKIVLPELAVSAKFEAPVLWIDDYKVENFDATLNKKGIVWSASGTASDDFRFDLTYNAKQDQLRGSAQTRALKLDELLEKFSGGASTVGLPSGLCDLRASITGPLHSPFLRLRTLVSDGHWRKESFTSEAVFTISPSTFSIVTAKTTLEKGGDVFLKGTVALNESHTMHLEGTAAGANLQSAFNLLEWPIRWEGQANGRFAMDGDKNDHRIEISFDGTHKGFGPFQQSGTLNGHIIAEKGEWNLDDIVVKSGEGYIKLLPGSRLYTDRNLSGTMRLVAEARNVQAGILTLFGGAEVTGEWQAGYKNGSEEPPFNLDFFARSLWINQFVLEGNITRLSIHKGELDFSAIPGSGQQLSGQLIYKNYPALQVRNLRLSEKGVDKFFIDGLIGPDKWDFKLNLKDIEASVVPGVFDTNLPISGPMSTQLHGQGSLKNPIIDADVHWKQGHFGILPVDTAEAKLHYKAGILELSNIVAQKKRGYQLKGQLKLDLLDDTKSPEINLVVDKGDFAMLEGMSPDISKARGSFEGKFSMGKKGEGRAISGYLNAQKIFITSAYTPSLEKGELKLRFDQNRLHVEEAVARLGKGDIALTGYVDFLNGSPSLYNIALKSTTAHGISVRIPELGIPPGPVLGSFGILKKKLAGISHGEPVINLTLKGPATSPTLAGSIDLVNTVFTYPPPPSSNKEKNNGLFAQKLQSFINNLNWKLALNAGSRTWYQNELVDANITGSFLFTGPTTDLDIDGKILTEQGSIIYSGNEFKIKSAEFEVQTKSGGLESTDQKQTYIYLKATAEKDVYYTDGLSNRNEDTIIMVVDRSLLGEIQPRFYSKNNPSLSSRRALQLALGLPISDSIDSDSLLPDQRGKETSKDDTDKMLRLGLVQLLDTNLASPLARAIAQHTGLVDFIRVTYQDTGSISDSTTPNDLQAPANSVTENQVLRYAKGTKVKFGRGISNRLFADYSFRVDEYQNQVDLRNEVELAYRVHRNLYLRGISELDRDRTLGRPPDRRAILENQWRFGLPRKKKNKQPQESRSTSNSTSELNKKQG